MSNNTPQMDTPKGKWDHERARAQAILATYGSSVAECLPAALLWMAAQTASTAHKNEEVYMYALADAMQENMRNRTDGLTVKTLICPLGKDIAFATAASKILLQPDIQTIGNACERVQAILSALTSHLVSHREPHHHDSDFKCFADVQDGIAGMRQVVIPLVFGGQRPLSPRVVEEVWVHITRGDEIACNKLLSFMPAERHVGIQFGPTGLTSMRMSKYVLKMRLEALKPVLPVRLYKCALALGFIGPTFFDKPAPRANYPFANTLVYTYAKYLRSMYEEPEDQ
jgi:hypothetical protein